MAHIFYDNDQPAHHDSAGHNRFRSNGSYALLAIVILFVLFFWADLGWMRGNLDSLMRGSRNSTAQPIEDSRIRPITEIRQVTADRINMREQPGNDARVSWILPRGTKVALLGESRQGPDGDVWLRVRVETNEGTHAGWVSQRYIE